MTNPLYSPTKAAREWAQRRGRADDAMLIEAWTTGWNARCIPEEPGALADHLRSMLLDGTVQCPLCGKTGPHPHSPEEIVIYRNGVKYGRSLKSASDEPSEHLYGQDHEWKWSQACRCPRCKQVTDQFRFDQKIRDTETSEQLKVGDPVSLNYVSPFGVPRDGWTIKSLPKPGTTYSLIHPNGGEVVAERFGFTPQAHKGLEQPPVDNDHIADGCEKFDE